MIFIGRINEVKPNEYDETYAIVRSMKNPSPWITQLPVLSPSKDLFVKYLALKKAGRWGTEAFEKIYLPRFLDEMRTETALDALNKLCRDSKAGKRIALVCFCTNETLCHRSIVAGILQGAGADVRLKSGADYSHYYKKI